jgi:hypothetical protein
MVKQQKMNYLSLHGSINPQDEEWDRKIKRNVRFWKELEIIYFRVLHPIARNRYYCL